MKKEDKITIFGLIYFVVIGCGAMLILQVYDLGVLDGFQFYERIWLFIYTFSIFFVGTGYGMFLRGLMFGR